MSLEQKIDCLQDNQSRSRYPKTIDELNDTYDGLRFSFTRLWLDEVNSQVEGYSDSLDERQSTAFDGKGYEYDWFYCAVYRRSGYEIVVAYPWRMEADEGYATHSDRSIAFYAKRIVPEEELENLSNALIAVFGDYKRRK